MILPQSLAFRTKWLNPTSSLASFIQLKFQSKKVELCVMQKGGKLGMGGIGAYSALLAKCIIVEWRKSYEGVGPLCSEIN